MKHPLSLPCLAFLQDASEFVCFIRLWWDGKGVDVGAWWHAASGFHKRVLLSGESPFIHKEPAVVLDECCSEDEFRSVVDELTALGLMALPSQAKKVAYTHYDDWYCLQHSALPQPHLLQIAGGIHSQDPDLRLMRFIYRSCPALQPPSQALENEDSDG